jgi:hypothetical protein
MDATIPQASISGYESLIDILMLPDPDDRHVLAAAIHGKAATIVTFNLRDFPVTATESFGISAKHPDDFVFELFVSMPSEFLKAVRRHRAVLHKPPKTAKEYIATLRQNRLTKMADILEKHEHEI